MPTLRALVCLALSAGLASCGGSGSTGTGGGSAPNSGQATVSMSMVDAPFRLSGQTVTAVTITIKEVELIGSGAPQILETFTPSQSVNLLNLTTVPGMQLGTVAVPAGTYQQARLLLDTSSPNNNSVTLADGSIHPLKIPSATGGNGFGSTSVDNGDGPGESGVKVNIGLNAVGGATYSILLDFNAAESIVTAGNSGQWIMKPVIVGSAYASGFFGGAVALAQPSGSPLPVVNAEVLAQQNGQTINSGVTGIDGTYQINALPQGSYTIVVNNAWTSQAGVSETAAPSNGVVSGTCPNTYAITTGETAVAVLENATPGPSASQSASPSPTASPTATPAPAFVCSP